MEIYLLIISMALPWAWTAPASSTTQKNLTKLEKLLKSAAELKKALRDTMIDDEHLEKQNDETSGYGGTTIKNEDIQSVSKVTDFR